jgi:hypothetical protein
MNQYVFILGRNAALSTAEILAVLPQAKVIEKNVFILYQNKFKIDWQG